MYRAHVLQDVGTVFIFGYTSWLMCTRKSLFAPTFRGLFEKIEGNEKKLGFYLVGFEKVYTFVGEIKQQASSIMKKFSSADFTAKNATELHEQVTSALRSYGYNVIDNPTDEELLRFFNDGCAPEDANTAADLDSSEEQRIVTFGEPEEGCNYQPRLTAVITAHFIDAGCDDYIYTVKVYEE